MAINALHPLAVPKNPRMLKHLGEWEHSLPRRIEGAGMP
jgi:hypothetical protein